MQSATKAQTLADIGDAKCVSRAGQSDCVPLPTRLPAWPPVSRTHVEARIRSVVRTRNRVQPHYKALQTVWEQPWYRQSTSSTRVKSVHVLWAAKVAGRHCSRIDAGLARIQQQQHGERACRQRLPCANVQCRPGPATAMAQSRAGGRPPSALRIHRQPRHTQLCLVA